jgi:hypothetical protein
MIPPWSLLELKKRVVKKKKTNKNKNKEEQSKGDRTLEG